MGSHLSHNGILLHENSNLTAKRCDTGTLFLIPIGGSKRVEIGSKKNLKFVNFPAVATD